MKYVGITPDGFELIAIRPADLSALKIAVEMLACIFADKPTAPAVAPALAPRAAPEVIKLCPDADRHCKYQDCSTAPAGCDWKGSGCVWEKHNKKRLKKARKPHSLPRDNSATKTPPRRAARNVASVNLAVARPAGGERPKQITCGCGKTVKVASRGPIPTRCTACKGMAGTPDHVAAMRPAERKEKIRQAIALGKRAKAQPASAKMQPKTAKPARRVSALGRGSICQQCQQAFPCAATGRAPKLCPACKAAPATPESASGSVQPTAPAGNPDPAKWACRSCRAPLKADESGLCKKCLAAAQKLRERLGRTNPDPTDGGSEA